jgi:hypothetical protein
MPGRFDEICSSQSMRAFLVEGIWDGFAWVGGQWQRVASGDTMAAAARDLSAAADHLGIRDGDTLLVRHGSAPTGPPLGRR